MSLDWNSRFSTATATAIAIAIAIAIATAIVVVIVPYLIPMTSIWGAKSMFHNGVRSTLTPTIIR